MTGYQVGQGMKEAGRKRRGAQPHVREQEGKREYHYIKQINWMAPRIEQFPPTSQKRKVRERYSTTVIQIILLFGCLEVMGLGKRWVGWGKCKSDIHEYQVKDSGTLNITL